MADEQQVEPEQGAEQQEASGQEPDYKALYEKAQADLDREKANARKWEGRSKANSDKAKAFDAAQAKSKTVEERLAALESENASLRAERDRAALVESVARATGLDAAIVGALNGADEDALTEQANAVKAAIGPNRRYPAVSDQGTATGPKALTDEEIAKIKNPAQRIRARAEAIHNSKQGVTHGYVRGVVSDRLSRPPSANEGGPTRRKSGVVQTNGTPARELGGKSELCTLRQSRRRPMRRLDCTLSRTSSGWPSSRPPGLYTTPILLRHIRVRTMRALPPTDVGD